MRDQIITKMLVLLLAVSCLIPLAALAAVLYLAAPVWLVAPTGLLARRLMALLAVDDGPGFANDIPAQPGLAPRGHDQH